MIKIFIDAASDAVEVQRAGVHRMRLSRTTSA
jgi:hypothetical protein